MNKKRNIILYIVGVFIVAMLVIGATFSYWAWSTNSNEEVNISLAVADSSNNLYARINGGEPVSSATVKLLPTNDCTGTHTLKRTVSITYKNATNMPFKIEASMDVTLFQLASSSYSLNNKYLSLLHWAITTDPSSCTNNLVSSGTFEGITFSNGQISNMTNDPLYGNIYNLNNGNPMLDLSFETINMQNETTTSNYYVYVWLDEDYAHTNYGNTNDDPMADFNLVLTWHGKIYQVPEKLLVVDNLIPVKISASGNTVTAVSENNSSWYDYSAKKWANAVLVSSTNRNNYIDLSDNQEVNIPLEEILAYFVWIPRYSYQVWAYNGSSSAGSPREIAVKFVSANTTEIATQNGEWYTHPAFWWDKDSDGVREDGEELSGIWVGKFETHHTSYSGTIASSLGCTSISCNNANNLRILPNKRPLTNNSVSSFFYVARSMEMYGNVFGINVMKADTHMMKNREWGAVAYLARSQYGINKEVRINNTYNYNDNGNTRTNFTGCGALTDNAGSTSSCDNQYGTVNSGVYPQSTTGNVTGVFDMSGSNGELVMGVWNNTISDSGFTSMPESKYYDNYPQSIFNGAYDTNFTKCTLSACGGHALYETKNWYSDSGYFVHNTSPWFLRGGNYSNTSSAGSFAAACNSGSGWSDNAFRIVLVKSPGSSVIIK